jgi:hypothetical protein
MLPSVSRHPCTPSSPLLVLRLAECTPHRVPVLRWRRRLQNLDGTDHREIPAGPCSFALCSSQHSDWRVEQRAIAAHCAPHGRACGGPLHPAVSTAPRHGRRGVVGQAAPSANSNMGVETCAYVKRTLRWHAQPSVLFRLPYRTNCVLYVSAHAPAEEFPISASSKGTCWARPSMKVSIYGSMQQRHSRGLLRQRHVAAKHEGVYLWIHAGAAQSRSSPAACCCWET